MRFVEIVPPQAGQLDEHKALVELTANDLEQMEDAVSYYAGSDPTPSVLELTIAEVREKLRRRIQLAGLTQDSQDMGTYDLSERSGNVIVCNLDDYWRTTAPRPDDTTTDQEEETNP